MTRQAGITLIELLITIALVSVIGLLIMNMYISSSRTYTDQNRILDVQRAGRIELEKMVRILRHAGLDPLSTANAGVEVAEAGRVRVTMDINLDGDVDDAGERVTYRRSGNVLQKGIGSAGAEIWQTLAENVSLFRIDYFGENNTAIPAPVSTAGLANIRSLVVTVTLQDAKTSGGNFTRTYSTSIYCRNLFQ